mgnify:CR=1 FL=1
MTEGEPLNQAATPSPERGPIKTYLDFEKPIAELESKIAELTALNAGDNSVSIAEEISKLKQKAHQALIDIYSKLTPWQKTLVARHPERPHSLDFIEALIDDFRARSGTVYHPSCTCRMGPDAATSVVDAGLRVHGVGGLRVIDASAFPNIIAGNTNAPSILMGWKGAEAVLKDAR